MAAARVRAAQVDMGAAGAVMAVEAKVEAREEVTAEAVKAVE